MRSSNKKTKKNRRKKLTRKDGWLGRCASIKSLKRYCDEIWSELIRARDGYKCFMCGSEEHLNAHHLISRMWLKTRYELNVGVLLCVGCHEFKQISASKTPWVLEQKLRKERREQYLWYLVKRQEVKNGPQNTISLNGYKAILKDLLIEFDKIEPEERLRSNYFKFTEDEEKQIIHEYRDLKACTTSIANKWGCSKSAILGIVKRNGVTRSELLNNCKIDKQKLLGHCVCKIDDKGNVLETYPSMNQAAISNGVAKNSIRNVINGRSKTSCGYNWKLQKDL